MAEKATRLLGCVSLFEMKEKKITNVGVSPGSHRQAIPVALSPPESHLVAASCSSGGSLPHCGSGWQGTLTDRCH